MPTPAGSIIIVTHNSNGYISECLRALPASGWEIVVIDNASEDDTVARVKTSSFKVNLIENQRNAGFAAAVNQGVHQAQTELLLILNPDSIARADALDSIRRVLQSPDAGAAGGLLVDANGQPQIGFVLRRFPRVADMLAEIFLLNRLWPRNPWNRRYRCLDFDYTRQQEVDQPAGACLAFRREIWEKVGGFDESFFPVWFEDVDFCRRIRDVGRKIIYTPDAVFTHAGAHSVGQIAYTQRQLYWYTNLQRYFRKHRSPFELGVLQLGIVIGLVLRSFLALLGAKPDGVGRWEAVRAYGRGGGSAFQVWRSWSKR